MENFTENIEIQDAKDFLLEMKDIRMSFGVVDVLHGVSLNLKHGEVLALVGENGAGKSTLMKILAGVYPQKSGKIILEGKDLSYKGPLERIDDGISVIYQELNYFDDLSIAENILVGRVPVKGFLKRVDRKKMNSHAQKVLDTIGLNVDPAEYCSTLTVAQKQLLEIAKAIDKKSKIVVMDEPTSALNETEVNNLFRIVHQLKSEGVSVIYITHKMDEIFQISDRVAVLRDGETVAIEDINSITKDEIISKMVGKIVGNLFPKHTSKPGEVLLDVRHLTIESAKIKDVSLTVHRGEIVTLYGLMGSGCDQLVKSFFGIGGKKIDGGEIFYKGTKVVLSGPRDAMAKRIAYIPSERKTEGVILCHSIKRNISLPLLETLRKGLSLDTKKEDEVVDDAMESFSIKATNSDDLVSTLSGGNQQKVVVAKWLLTHPDFIIVNEPTKGVDVGAKAEIYEILEQMCSEGLGVIMISTELPEVIAMSDRIYVMREGEITTELSGEEANQEELLRYAM